MLLKAVFKISSLKWIVRIFYLENVFLKDDHSQKLISFAVLFNS